MNKVEFENMTFGSRYRVNIYYPETGSNNKFIGEFNHLRGNSDEELRPTFINVLSRLPGTPIIKWSNNVFKVLHTSALPTTVIISCYPCVSNELKDKIKNYDSNYDSMTKKLQIRYMADLYARNRIYLDNSLALNYVWCYLLDLSLLNIYKQERYEKESANKLLVKHNVHFDNSAFELLIGQYLEKPFN